MTTLSHPVLIQADPLLVETVTRLLDDHCSPDVPRAAEASHRADAELWRHLSETGLNAIGAADGRESGGIVDAVALLQACGAHAAPVPIAEHGVLAGWLLAQAGLAQPGGMLTVPVADAADRVALAGGRVRARFTRVPFAVSATHIVAAIGHGGDEMLAVAPIEEVSIDPSVNLAGEPRDIVELDAPIVAALPAGTVAALGLRASLGRVALSAGAMRRAVHLASEYAHDRRQFGRPIGAFQAVQHLLALAAEHMVNATAACWVAADALADDGSDPFHRVEVARVVAHEAMEIVTRNCHQTFGAIGVTKEHELHLHTRRLLAWDLEWAAPRDAARELSCWLAGLAPGARWGALTGVALPH